MNRRGGRGSRGRGTSSGDQNRVVENGQFNSNFVQSSRDDHQGGGNNNPRARSSSRGRGRVGNNLQQGQHPPRGPDPRGQQQHAARQHKQQQEIGGPGTDAFSQSSDVYRPDKTHPQKKKAHASTDRVSNIAGTNHSVSSRLAPRPGYETTDGSMQLITNYFSISILKRNLVYKYSVKIKLRKETHTGIVGATSSISLSEPPGARHGSNAREDQDTSAPKRRVLFKRLFLDPYFAQPATDNLASYVATDYAAILVSAKQLPLDGNDFKIFPVTYCETGERDPRRNADIYDMTVTTQGLVSMEDLLKSPTAMTRVVKGVEKSVDAFQILNLIVAALPNTNQRVFQTGANKFFELPAQVHGGGNVYDNWKLTGGPIAVRGYYSSVRPSISGLLLNVNTQCSPFYPSMLVSQLLDRFPRDSRNWHEIEHFIRFIRVQTSHLRDEHRRVIYRVRVVQGFRLIEVRRDNQNRIVPGDSENTTFQIDGGEICSVAKWFRDKHSEIHIDVGKPVLNCGTREKPVWIPSELCTIMPGQPYRRKLSDLQTTAMLNIAAKPPGESARRIVEDGLRVLGVSLVGQNRLLNQLGIQIETEMTSVQGKQLQSPLLQFGNQRMGGWPSWNVRDKTFLQPKSVGRWTYVNINEAGMNGNYLSNLIQQMERLGMGRGEWIQNQGLGVRTVDVRSEETVDAGLRSVLQDARNLNINNLLVVLPRRSTVIYERLKSLADLEFGIQTVVLRRDKPGKPFSERWVDGTYWGNIALKLNMKAGGVNHTLVEGMMQPLNTERTMIVGIDVTHPSNESVKEAPSIAAVVASEDKHYAKWPGSVRTNTSGQEMVDELADMIKERLEYYRDHNPRLPSDLLVYRDGVSEGQYAQVLDKELPKIEAGARSVYGEQVMPRITIVIAGKRHHTRFYITDRRDGSPTEKFNTPAGTLVDTTVTMADAFDFYLQAHQALKGTAKPTHYVVIKNDMNLGAADIQHVTHNLSYLFGRSTKAVSLCSPAYYADRLCERGRCYFSKYLLKTRATGAVEEYTDNMNPFNGAVHRGVHNALKNTMFYI